MGIFTQDYLNGIANRILIPLGGTPPVINGPFKYLPPVSSSFKPNAKKAKPAPRETTTSPAGGVHNILMGRKKIQSQGFVYLKVINNLFHGIFIFGKTEWDACEELLLDGKTPGSYSPAVYTEIYTGTEDQEVCGLSVDDPTFDDAMPGIVYAYVRWSPSVIAGIPRVEGIWRGMKMYDPRSGQTAYSANPALELACVMTDPDDGQRIDTALINWDSVKAAADWHDMPLGEAPNQQKRAEGHLLFTGAPLPDALNMIKLHGLLTVGIDADGKYRIDALKPRDPVASFSDVNDKIWGLETQDVKSSDIINAVRWRWTDPTTWEEVDDEEEDPALGATDEIHEGNYDLTGCQSLSQSKRIATYLLNQKISDLPVTFMALNYKGLQKGDVFTLTWRTKFDQKQFECLAIDRQDKGFLISAREYDPAMFSEAIVEEPTYPDTTLPDPDTAPADASGLVLEEEMQTLKDSTAISVIKIQWTRSTWAWIKGYKVYAKQGAGSYVLIASPDDGKTAAQDGTPLEVELRPVKELVEHTIKVVTVSKWHKESAGITEVITPQGKFLSPVWKEGAALTGEEAGDIVFLRWAMSDKTGPAIDTNIAGYQLRRGRTTDTWESLESAEPINCKTDTLSYQDKTCPSGTWRYFLKALDSVGNETETALTVDVTATLNPNVGFQQDRTPDFAGGALTTCQVMDDGTITPVDPSYDTLGERFPGTLLGDGVGDDYNNLNLPAPASATAISAVLDLGQIIAGQFTLYYAWQKLGSGTASLAPKLLLSSDNSNWTEYDASSSFSATARYVKAKFVFASSAVDTTYIVEAPIYVRVQAQLKGENSGGTVNIGAGGSLTVTFTNTYLAEPKVKITVFGTPRTIVADSLTTTGMVLKSYDNTNTLAAGSCQWEVEGY